MKTKFLCALLLTSFGFAQEPVIEEKKEIAQNFGYMSLGLGPLPVPLPVFGLGYQAQVNRHGVDVSLQALTVVVTLFWIATIITVIIAWAIVVGYASMFAITIEDLSDKRNT